MIRFLHLVMLVVLPFFGDLFAQEKIGDDNEQLSQSRDPRISKILTRIETFQNARERGIEQRTKNYVKDLKALEQNIQSTGILERVLEVTKEREAWAARTKTTPINPKDNSVGLALRKLRYYFDLDLQRIRTKQKENSAKINGILTGEIDQLVKALTTEGKIPEALALRNIKKGLVVTNAPPIENTAPIPTHPKMGQSKTNQTPANDRKKWGRNTWINENASYRPETPLNPPHGSIKFEVKTAKTKTTIPVKIEVSNLPRGHKWALIAVSQQHEEYREISSGFEERKPPEEITISLYPFSEPWDIYLLAMSKQNWESVVAIRDRFDRERSKGAISEEIKALRRVRQLKEDGNLFLEKAEILITR